MKRRFGLLIVAAAFASMGASYRTQNFVVHAPTAQVAQMVGQWAEFYRKDRAVAWLGREMPPWREPCPLTVHVGMEGPSGATTFQFNLGGPGVLSQKMEIRGPLDRLISSVLPHEITHTVFAHYFQVPVPRWADEGGSVLSEDDIERTKHDKIVRNILNHRQQIPLRTLLSLTQYPQGKIICLYAQGFSLADYLVKRTDRQTFLNFVAHGMQRNYGWDNAVQRFYGHRSVEELESAWLKYLRDTKQNPNLQLAKDGQNSGTRPAANTVVRLTAPPIQPLDPAPVVRGQAPTSDQPGPRFGDIPGMPVSRPGSVPTIYPVPGSGWQPVPPPPPTMPVHSPQIIGAQPRGPVQLGIPQFDPAAFPGPVPAGFPQ